MASTVAVVGWSDSGKTTLLERLLPVLRERGYRVATVKHHGHGGDADLPAKDTRRHWEAGAEAVALVCPGRLAVWRRCAAEPNLEEVVRLLESQVPGLDLVLAEGFKHWVGPKIEVLGDGGEVWKDPNLLAVVVRKPLAARVPALPADDPQAVADFLERHVLAAARP